ncbi:MAG TPA: hypothetical protein VGD87_17295 [Archangium sp.]
MSALKRYSMDATGRAHPDARGSWVFFEDLPDASLSEQVDALTKRLDFITGCVREELVRRAVEAARFRLVSIAVGEAVKYATNSDIRIGAQKAARAIEEADLSGVVPSVTALLDGTQGESSGDEVRKLVQQLADANAEIARLKGGAS